MKRLFTFILMICAACVAGAANYLTFTAEEDSSTFRIINNGKNNPDIEYSLDGGETWTALAGTKIVTLSNKGDNALLRGNNPDGFSKAYGIYTYFWMTGKIAASGSVMSLIDGSGLSTEIPCDFCFYRLFYSCASLTKAPDLPAITLADRCYEELFLRCTSLNYISVSFVDWPSNHATDNWVKDVAPNGTFICPTDFSYNFGNNGIPWEWKLKNIIDGDTVDVVLNHLTFTAEEDGSTFGIVNYDNNPNVQYSLDGGETWTSLTNGDTITLVHKGDKALLRGKNMGGFSKNEDMFSTFTMTGKIAASGNVMSLIDKMGLYKKITSKYCFNKLFSGCTSLTQAPELPATTLAKSCYQEMFSGCTSLTHAPELPATKLAQECYNGMFSGCTRLMQAPKLPATSLLGSCYSRMFEGCTSLSNIIVSFKKWNNNTTKWVKDVAPTGTFICPKELPLVFGNSAIPLGWMPKHIINGDTIDATFDTNYLTFIAEEENSTFGIVNKENYPDVQYSLDGGKTWKALEEGDTVRLVLKGDKALLAGYNPNGFSKGWGDEYSSFTMSGKIAASGSVMSLIDGAGLSTEIPEAYCFYNLFSGCTSLTQAPKLPATTLADYCYERMFSGCTSLTQAPELPATTLAGSCYYCMFSSCTSLTQAPELPATTLADYCYRGMFSNCTSLTQAPELPATVLDWYCYWGMFSGCTSLSQISVSFDDWGGYYTDEWVKDVAPAGTFICPKALALEYGESMIPKDWMVKNYNYLTFTAEEDGSTFGIVNNENNPDVQYSLDDGETWTALTGGKKVTLAHKGDKALLAGYNPNGFSKRGDNYSSFSMTGKIAASGSVMSLIDGLGLSTEIPEAYCFYNLFSGCTSLTQAPELPATTLADYCYDEMFSGCTSLTQATELPATTLAENCYESMFSGCTSLTEAPKLPATTLVDGDGDHGCYSRMFEGCTSLTQAPKLPATTLAVCCYREMFSGCTSLTQAPELPATTLAENCYESMFSGCTSLTQAPELPATTLAEGCYSSMFHACTNLTTAPELPATELTKGCYGCMFFGCTSLTQVPELPATTLARSCYSSMFSGCTSLTQAPKLPANTLTNYCYYDMFSGCTSLTQAPELPATTLANGCYEDMLSGCSSLTQAPELPATALATNCYRAMFSNCTSLTQAPELPATILVRDCYYDMFSGCTNLSQISVSFDDWSDNYTNDWSKDVAPTGTFICPKELPLVFGNSAIPLGWMPKHIINGDTIDATFDTNYLTFIAEEENSTFGIVNNENNPDLQYSLDGGKTWKALEEGDTVRLVLKGDKALLAGYNPNGFSKGWWDKYSSFSMSGKIAASGSVMSLIDGAGLSTEIPEAYCFYNLFSGCTSLTQAPELPATTLAGGCYREMFSGCTSLTQAPELPAITLANSCYCEMFAGCTSLTKAPELPATTLDIYCYNGMFSGCTSLAEIKVHFSEWIYNNHYLEENTSLWVKDVAPTGTFICPKALPRVYGPMIYVLPDSSFIDDNMSPVPYNGNDPSSNDPVDPAYFSLDYIANRIPAGWTVKYIDDEPTIAPAVTADGLNIWTEGLTIIVSGATGRVEVFDASGARLRSESSAGDACTFTMPAHGVYLVRTSKRTVKVVL